MAESTLDPSKTTGRMAMEFFLGATEGKELLFWFETGWACQRSRRFEGYWSQGKQNGMGYFYKADGTRKHGEWVNGKRIRWVDE